MLNYLDYVDRLNGTHGLVKFRYREWFYDDKQDKWRLIDKNKREGLVVHHVMENTLSNCSNLKKYPIKYECHNKENLVYCNSLEHLYLHLLIIKEYNRENAANVIPLLLYQAIKDFPYLEYKKWYDRAIEEIYDFSKYLNKYIF